MRLRVASLLSALSLLALTSCASDPWASRPEPRVSTMPPGTALATPRIIPGMTQEFPQTPDPSTRIPQQVTQVKIGLLVPLTGESQALGQSMLDAANLALYDQYVSLKGPDVSARVVLIPKDTGSGPSSAVVAANQAIEQGVSLFIGPVFSSSVSSIAPIAKKANVPILSLSNNRTIAGPDVYVYGFLPEQQVARAANFASLKNISSMGALVPNDAYGSGVAETLKTTLNPKGVLVQPIEMYARSPANLDAAIIRLKEGYSKTPFQALYLAEGGDQLKTILRLLKARQLDRTNFRLVGTGLWDEADILKNPDMTGSWFASSPPDLYAQFEKRFMAVYGYKPKRLASLAYDAVSLATSLALAQGGPNYTPYTMTRREGFIGPANGLYRLRPDGTTERALAVMEILPGGDVKILDGAQKTF